MIGRLLLIGAGWWLWQNRAPAIAAPAGAPGEPSIYIVKTGDSLSIIARDELGKLERWPELARLNNIGPPYVIRPGDELLMPGDY